MENKKIAVAAASAVVALSVSICAFAENSVSGSYDFSGGVYSWNFTGYDNNVVLENAAVYTAESAYADAEFHLAAGDDITESKKIKYNAPSVIEPDTNNFKNIGETGRYIRIDAKVDGTLTLRLEAHTASTSRKVRMYVDEFTTDPDQNTINSLNKDSKHYSQSKDIIEAWTVTDYAIKMTAGKTYILYTYHYGTDIYNIKFTPASAPAKMTKIATEESDSELAEVYFDTVSTSTDAQKISVYVMDSAGINIVSNSDDTMTVSGGGDVSFAAILSYSDGSSKGYIPVYAIE